MTTKTKRQRITSSDSAVLCVGAVIVDSRGRKYRGHSMRHDYLEAHPIIDGRAVVNADSRIIFHLNPHTAQGYPARRHDPIYATGAIYSHA